VQIPATQINAAGGAMTQLYDNIASGAIASWDVTGISQAYNHLMILLMGRGDTAATSVGAQLRFNNDSAAGKYTSQYVYGFGGSAAGVFIGGTFLNLPEFSAATSDAGACSAETIHVPSYTQTTFHKSITLTVYNPRTYGSGSEIGFSGGGAWKDTSAINRVTIFPATGNFVTGSRLTIYGLL
jgi:hypothetical protein